MVRKSIAISGRVQGVFFRKHLAEKAMDCGCTGFVENRPDGSVYAEVQGKADQVEEVLRWCHHGPPQARVDNVVWSAKAVQPEDVFSIRR